MPDRLVCYLAVTDGPKFDCKLGCVESMRGTGSFETITILMTFSEVPSRGWVRHRIKGVKVMFSRTNS